MHSKEQLSLSYDEAHFPFSILSVFLLGGVSHGMAQGPLEPKPSPMASIAMR